MGGMPRPVMVLMMMKTTVSAIQAARMKRVLRQPSVDFGKMA
jgi:hypothetical protein